jgi:peptidoglycan/xylan/chitin deacetylase (PgdA/CDA1 family)
MLPLPDAIFFAQQHSSSLTPKNTVAEFSYGGIVRMDRSSKTIYLAFTGHDFSDGSATIEKVLRIQSVKASFFFTGDFYHNPDNNALIRALLESGHYLGPHSDKHLLYATWEKRDSLLVTKEEFLADLRNNYIAMQRFGIGKNAATTFMPAYEWYNDSISAWCKEEGVQLINFTGGTSSNADYTYPELGARYIQSDTIYSRILAFESTRADGLNGFILLLHIGADPRRSDKFYHILERLLVELKERGYGFAGF